MTQFEVCIDSVASLLRARDAGASRVELCSALREGGLTPSFGLIAQCVAQVKDTSCEVWPIIRPRGGDFVFGADAQMVMKADVEAALEAGAHGVVIGNLHADGSLNTLQISELVAIAGEGNVAFHRAIDHTPDVEEALLILGELGVCRVLTSGNTGPLSDEAVDTLVGMLEAAPSNVEIMAGGGLTLDIAATLCALGIDAIHATSRHGLLGASATSEDAAGNALCSCQRGGRPEACPQVLERLQHLASYNTI